MNFALKLPFFLLILLPFFGAEAQQYERTNFWFFGSSAGIDFNVPTTGLPVSGVSSFQISSEGCLTMSDTNGNLLFYCDGVNLYDATHFPTPNGLMLLGDQSSTQSSLAVPRPGHDSIYYLFTTDGLSGPNGFRYNVINMNLNGGFGDIEANQKNLLLETPVLEKLCSVKSPDEEIYWVLVHETQSPNYLAYKVDTAGLDTGAVVSPIVPMGNSGYLAGQMKFSPDAKWTAAVAQVPEEVVVTNFDPATGILSTPWSIELPPEEDDAGDLYGLEFSPNSRFMYVSRYGVYNSLIYQYDFQSGDSTQIRNSISQIVSFRDTINGTQGFGSMQTGADGRIYMTRETEKSLSVIHQPNFPGPASNYDDLIFDLDNHNAFLGLPNFSADWLQKEIFSYADDCQGDTIQFTLFNTSGIDSIVWHFSDPGSGADSISNDFHPQHVFTNWGTIPITITIFNDSGSSSITEPIFIRAGTGTGFTEGLDLCLGVSSVIDVSRPNSTFLWSTGDTTASITVDMATMVWVTIANACDTATDTIPIFYQQPFAFDLGPDSNLCDRAALVLDPGITGVDFRWQDNSTDSIFTASETGLYFVTASNICDTITDSVQINVFSIPTVDLGEDQDLCEAGQVLLISPALPDITYQWQNNSNVDTLTVTTSGTYWLNASNFCGDVRDSVSITYYTTPMVALGNDTNVCPGDTVILDATFPGAEYIWEPDGFITPTIPVTEDGEYIVQANIGPCLVADTMVVNFQSSACFIPIDCTIEFPNVFTPNFDGYNEIFQPHTTCGIISYHLRIYNRFGQQVFESFSAQIGWDGFVRGQLASEGVYFWYLDYKDEVVVNQDRLSRTGSLTLIR